MGTDALNIAGPGEAAQRKQDHITVSYNDASLVQNTGYLGIWEYGIWLSELTVGWKTIQ